jgi:hypothetical protein
VYERFSDHIERAGKTDSNVNISSKKANDDSDDDDRRKRKIPDLTLLDISNPSRKKREVAHKYQFDR